MLSSPSSKHLTRLMSVMSRDLGVLCSGGDHQILDNVASSL
jgi:hypothetical protein